MFLQMSSPVMNKHIYEPAVKYIFIATRFFLIIGTFHHGTG